MAGLTIRPLPAPTIDMHDGLAAPTITFPEEDGRLIRDHGMIVVSAPSLCPGGCGRQLPMWKLAVAMMVMPERLLIVGCWLCTFSFAADRGAEKRRRAGAFLASGLVVAPDPNQPGAR